MESHNYLNRRNIVKEYPLNNNYLVSTDGRIFSKRMHKYLIPKKNWDGYLRIQIWKKNKCHMISWHRVVAQTFLPNPNNYPVINHKDGNKQNNVVTNLEWCTQKDNIIHSYKMGLSKVHSRIKINQYDLNNNFIRTWDSLTEAAKNVHGEITSICAACRGRIKSSKGYIWKYCEISNDYRKPIKK